MDGVQFQKVYLEIAHSLSSLDNAFFSFTLEGFGDNGAKVPNPVPLDQRIYFKATVVTQSGAPNLDLFPVKCWSSKSVDPDVANGDFTLIENG